MKTDSPRRQFITALILKIADQDHHMYPSTRATTIKSLIKAYDEAIAGYDTNK